MQLAAENRAIANSKERIQTTLKKYIESLAEAAENSYQQYPEHEGLLPNDAVYLARITELNNLCEIIATSMVEYNNTFAAVMEKLHAMPNLPYKFMGEVVSIFYEKRNTLV